MQVSVEAHIQNNNNTPQPRPSLGNTDLCARVCTLFRVIIGTSIGCCFGAMFGAVAGGVVSIMWVVTTFPFAPLVGLVGLIVAVSGIAGGIFGFMIASETGTALLTKENPSAVDKNVAPSEPPKPQMSYDEWRKRFELHQHEAIKYKCLLENNPNTQQKEEYEKILFSTENEMDKLYNDLPSIDKNLNPTLTQNEWQAKIRLYQSEVVKYKNLIYNTWNSAQRAEYEKLLLNAETELDTLLRYPLGTKPKIPVEPPLPRCSHTTVVETLTPYAVPRFAHPHARPARPPANEPKAPPAQPAPKAPVSFVEELHQRNIQRYEEVSRWMEKRMRV